MKITDKCTGCRTCENVCPQKCIFMKTDKEGFLVPVVNESICVSCGICRKKCPQNIGFKNEFQQKVYAARLKDDNAIKKSSSGGLFAALARNVINNGGVAFGAAYTEAFGVEHIKAENEQELEKLLSSKYVQSNTSNTYRMCKEYLENGRKVLYSGTPCQIAGLKSYLSKEYDDLVTVDLICHGVPSQKLFKKYISWLSNKMKEPIEYYNFRTKKNIGWGVEYRAEIKTKNKVEFISGNLDPYYSRFLSAEADRMCCYECKYANLNRVGDITIGDYWGIEKYHPDFYDKKGVSSVIINTAIGQQCFEDIKNDIEYIESDLSSVSAENKNLLMPTEMPEKRKYIYKEIDSLSTDKYIKKYFKIPAKQKIKVIIKKAMPEKLFLYLKRTIKK